MKLEEALEETGAAETGYTVTVSMDEEDGGYMLYFANGAMPPYLSLHCADLEIVREEISTSYLGDPDLLDWKVVSDEDEE